MAARAPSFISRRRRRVVRILAALAGGFVLGSLRTVAGETPAFKPHPAPRPLPEMRFQDAKGKPRTLADFRGRVVLLNVWATWCPSCREEMPALDRLQARLGGRDFEVVALSIDHGGTVVVEAFFDELAIKALALYIDPSGKAMGKLGIVGIPTTLLIDREGRELWRVSGPLKWDTPEIVDAIRKFLNSPSKP